MSNLYQKKMPLAGLDVDGLSVDQLKALVRQVLDAGIHGLCFSPYVEGQGPGDPVTEAQTRGRLAIVRPFRSRRTTRPSALYQISSIRGPASVWGPVMRT